MGPFVARALRAVGPRGVYSRGRPCVGTQFPRARRPGTRVATTRPESPTAAAPAGRNVVPCCRMAAAFCRCSRCPPTADASVCCQHEPWRGKFKHATCLSQDQRFLTNMADRTTLLSQGGRRSGHGGVARACLVRSCGAYAVLLDIACISPPRIGTALRRKEVEAARARRRELPAKTEASVIRRAAYNQVVHVFARTKAAVGMPACAREHLLTLYPDASSPAFHDHVAVAAGTRAAPRQAAGRAAPNCSSCIRCSATARLWIDDRRTRSGAARTLVCSQAAQDRSARRLCCSSWVHTNVPSAVSAAQSAQGVG